MQKVKITDFREHSPDFLKKVSNGEQINITNHVRAIARLIPEFDEVEAAQKRLDALSGSMIIGEIIEPLDLEWNADADNL